MKKIILLLMCMLSLQLSAQKINKHYNNVSISQALKELNSLQNKYIINFIYNDLEDFRVSANIRNKTVPEAIMQMIAFYPIKMTEKENNILFVECTHKTSRHLTGKLIDEHKQPLEFANIALYSPADTTLLSGGVSNESGVFVIPYETSKVLAKISYVGYKTIWRTFTSEDAGTIQLSPEQHTLSAVTVKGHQTQYKMSKEGITTNVENTPLSQLGSADDLLQHVPMVNKNAEGEFSVFGKGTPLIYLNGRKVYDNNELKRLKSTDMKNVEVITTPGAQYDASVQSVIKIQTKKKQGEGWGFDAKAEYSQGKKWRSDNEFNWTFSNDKLQYFGMVGYEHRSNSVQNNVLSTVNVDTLWQEKTHIQLEEQINYLSNKMGVNYAINENNTIGATYDFEFILASNHNPYSTTNDITANGSAYDHLENQFNYVRHSSPYIKFNTFYIGKIGSTTVDFNIDYLYKKEARSAFYYEKSENKEDREFNTYSPIHNRMWATKLIVSHPVYGGNLSLGAEYSNTYRKDDYICSNNIIANSYNTIKQNKIAPFIEYNKTTAIGIITAGLRYENIALNYYENNKLIDEQSRKYNNIFPSISLATQLAGINLQLGYSVKTKHPTYGQLRSNVAYASRFLYQSGNPMLKDEIIHDITLQGVWKFVQFSFSFKHHKDAIRYDAYQHESNNAITVFTQYNEPSVNKFSAFVSAAPKIGIWNPMWSVGMIKQWLNIYYNNVAYKLNNPVGIINLDNSFRFSPTLCANIDFSLQTKGHTMNVKLTRNIFQCHFSITKTLLNNHLSMILKANDIFHGMKDGNLLYNQKMTHDQTNIYDTRRISLTMRYNFNLAKNKYKGKGAGNDEVKRL